MSSKRLSDIQYTSDEDLALSERMNDNGHPLQYGNIVDAFRARVSASSDSILLSYSGRTFTYADVDALTDSVASAVRGSGIPRGDPVAVMVPRSEWYLIGALGVLKTGSPYVPIDTAYPDERIEFILRDSGARAVLVTR